jgi:hypothetical protein
MEKLIIWGSMSIWGRGFGRPKKKGIGKGRKKKEMWAA